MDPTGKSDPYCVVIVGNQEQRTVVQYSTVCPTWHETLQFEVSGVPQLMQNELGNNYFLSLWPCTIGIGSPKGNGFLVILGINMVLILVILGTNMIFVLKSCVWYFFIRSFFFIIINKTIKKALLIALRMFTLIVSVHTYCARKFTCHIIHERVR